MSAGLSETDMQAASKCRRVMPTQPNMEMTVSNMHE